MAGLRKRWAVDHQQLLIVLVSAVMVGSFVLLVFWPKQQQLSDLGSQVSRQRELVNLKVRNSQEGLYVSARVAALRSIRGRLERSLPEDVRLAEFLEAVGECVRAEKGLTHEIQRVETESAGPVPADMSAVALAKAEVVRLRLTGPFEAVHRCLAQVESLERLNRMRRLHVKRLDETGQVVAEAEVHIYYLPAEEAKRTQHASAEPKAEVVRG
jgi:Tfp pilus assembly protein PilO